MSAYRPRIIASLCLMLTAAAVAACAVLLRPEPAGAAGTRSRRIAFSPLWVAPNQGISFWYVNSGNLPNPPATVTFVNVLNGSVFGELSLMSEAPGRGRGDQINNPGPGAQLIATFVTFNQPAGGQAIPNPLPGNVQVWEGQKPLAVIGPAH